MITTFYEPEQLDFVLIQSIRPAIEEIANSTKTAHGFAKNTSLLDQFVLARHAIEHVKRIRMFRSPDAAATNLIQVNSPLVYEKWASYARSEAVHDRYYLRDLREMGISSEAVDQTELFSSTQGLVHYVENAMMQFGALPVVLYSFWTEQNSDIGSQSIIDRTGAVFGVEAIKGASAHRALDEKEDHAEAVTEVLVELIKNDQTLAIAADLLQGISYWIKCYFTELDDWHSQQSAEVS